MLDARGMPGTRMSQRATLPRTIACVSPPTGIWSSSRTMCTRPARPSTGSWLATYDAGCLDPASHCGRRALRLPVTGSSPTPSDGTNARTSASLPWPPAGE